jgi:hypothetical protein
MRHGLGLSLLALAALASAAAQERAPAPASGASVDVAALQAEVERLRSIMPSQATAMTQIAYNFSNLWFAAHEQNWPLAQFYANETRVRLRWAVRITPTRKLAGGALALQPILDGIEKGQLTALDEAVAAKSVKRLETAYHAMMDACYGCHTASEKPYLKLQVPKAPAEPMIDFEAK